MLKRQGARLNAELIRVRETRRKASGVVNVARRHGCAHYDFMPASAGRDFRFLSLIPGVALASRMRNVRACTRRASPWTNNSVVARPSLFALSLSRASCKTRYSAASRVHLLILIHIRPSPSRSDAGNLISRNPVI
jgi:hypothetical protein